MNAPRKHPLGARLRHWHRRLGITAALFVAWLAISGVALNEGTALGLDQFKISGRFISGLYGFSQIQVKQSYVADGHWLAVSDAGATLDGRLIQATLAEVVGFVSVDKLLYVGLKDGLVLMTPEGQIIEHLGAESLPLSSIRRVGLGDANQIAIEGGKIFLSTDALRWSERPVVSVTWSQQVELPADQRSLAMTALQPQFPLSRVLADAHSGRLFGRYGHWVVDAVGFAALLLALTGSWIYLRARHRQQHLR